MVSETRGVVESESEGRKRGRRYSRGVREEERRGERIEAEQERIR